MLTPSFRLLFVSYIHGVRSTGCCVDLFVSGRRDTRRVQPRQGGQGNAPPDVRCVGEFSRWDGARVECISATLVRYFNYGRAAVNYT